jgi:hypothetical protein
VAMLLQEQKDRVEELWLSLVGNDQSLSKLPSDRTDRLVYLHSLLDEIIGDAQSYFREQPLQRRGSAVPRNLAGYTPRTMLTEFCLLRKAIAQIVQENLLAVNLSYLVPDLARVNETLDEQAQAALGMLSK